LSTAANLKEGTYQVLITDDNGCFINREFVLVDPELFPVDLGPDRVLCKDQSLDYDVTMTDAQYVWLKDGAPFASSGVVQLADAGTYHLTITDVNGCSNGDEIHVSRTDSEISASIIVASRGPLNEKIRIANISYPAPDRVEWIIPQGATVLEETPGYLDLMFNAKGEYAIGLTGFRGACEKVTHSRISIVDKADLTDYQSPDEPYIKQFSVTPNPNNGRFTVTVELREAEDFNLVLTTLQGTPVLTQPFSNQNFVRHDFDVTNQTGKGLYVLQLITKNGQSIFKVAIQ